MVVVQVYHQNLIEVLNSVPIEIEMKMVNELLLFLLKNVQVVT